MQAFKPSTIPLEFISYGLKITDQCQRFRVKTSNRGYQLLFGGRKIDLRTPEDLSRYFRQRVVEEAEVQYARG